MVMLVSMRKAEASAAQQEFTRSGSELIPAIIRAGGPKAVESFLCFFAQATNRHTAHVYRSAANHFFRWCDDAGLSLETLKVGHVVGFFQEKTAVWAPSTARTYFSSLRVLFDHLDSDRVVDRTPFAGADAPQLPKPKKPPVTLETLKTVVRDLDNDDEASEGFRAGLVVMYPFVVGGQSSADIAGFTGLPLAEVEKYAQNLRSSGIWTTDGKIAFESDPDTPEAWIEIILQVLCALGYVEHVSAEACG